jgi:hypothetical protein
MVEAGHLRLSEDWKEALDEPITSDELKVATYKGKATRHREETA